MAWMKLIRLPNILILAAIFILLHAGIYLPFYASLSVASPMNGWAFVVFVLSVCMIASGGNIINDYFDYQIDLINKPDKMVIDKMIPKETAMSGYMVLTFAGIAGGFLTGFLIGIYKIGFFFGFGALMLYWYSEKFKRKLLVGNLMIALLAFLFIVLLWLVEFFALRNSAGSFVVAFPSSLKINMIMGIYAVFAFLTTLIREIIKDAEDVEGDQKNGCRTLPITFGLPIVRMIVNSLIVSTILLLVACQYLCWNNSLKVLSIFIAPAIQLPLILLLIRFNKADSKSDFHAASTSMKWIMVAGILGIQLINIHF
ncbi:MAG: geranylgeranylglycerol-phosphate geranylgeranyltransferase [Bacteroidota bacterium]|nr:geranylgeranylglycerol-phosphate geranylgeranyltransferase [Bacteroidota bacterium]